MLPHTEYDYRSHKSRYLMELYNNTLIMSKHENMRAADIVAEALVDWDVDTIFGLPGDGINGFIEALRTRHDKIKFVLVRHEESAAFMASAYAKYTGKLGVCVATSGPGAIHLLNGLYDAKLDGAPVVAITGRTYSDLMGSGYQQDVDQLQLFSDVSVYNNMINEPEQAEMVVDIACRTALSQRGVSHFTIPIDVQEKVLKGKYSKHKVPGHTSDMQINFEIMPSDKKTQEDDSFLREKQQAMQQWVKKLQQFRNINNNSSSNKAIKPQVIAAAVSEELEDNAIISVDSGTNTFWAARHINVRKGMKFSVSGTLASMACGLPYAIAAQIAFPERQSIAFVGDGGFMMLMAEFSTAVQYKLPIKVIILKNNTLGMIRWEQMGFLGNPEYGVEFTPIDFAGFAENCGGKGYRIKKPEDVKSVMQSAMS